MDTTVIAAAASRYLALTTMLFLASGAASTAFAQRATLEATPPRTAAAGSTVTVNWSGPNGPGDYITVVRRGADPSQYLDYRMTGKGREPQNPLTLVLPAETGPYEIRYVSGDQRRVLAALPYEVTAAAATVEGPASVAPGGRFEVTWSGPNNKGDWVTIVAAGAAASAYGSYVDARSGRADEPAGRRGATLQAPTQPGSYELRYIQQGTHIIGRRAIVVGASPAIALTGPPIATATPRDPAQGRVERSMPSSTPVPTTPTTSSTPATSATGPSNSPAVTATASPGSSSAPVGGQQVVSPTASTGGTAVLGTEPVVDNCTLPLTIPQGSVRVTPGSVYFDITGIQIGCNLHLFGGSCHPLAVVHSARYVIHRSDRPDPVFNKSGLIESVDIRTPMEFGRSYTFNIVGEAFRTGPSTAGTIYGCGRAQVSVTPPLPAIPIISAVRVTGNSATIVWETTSQAESGYLVIGPGLPSQGLEISNHWSIPRHATTGALARGTHTWLVTPYWDTPAGRAIDVSRGARATATIP